MISIRIIRPLGAKRRLKMEPKKFKEGRERYSMSKGKKSMDPSTVFYYILMTIGALLMLAAFLGLLG
ncbi:hypothetical protein A3K63_03550 [Candidatus Micrarchaeota archaeon RBG_16_49_10]|nr:MAG: hypothetical protein A3K63_03550 [Candidatus Micrarchaeota archaeon RBG_16_49_10]